MQRVLKTPRAVEELGLEEAGKPGVAAIDKRCLIAAEEVEPISTPMLVLFRFNVISQASGDSGNTEVVVAILQSARDGSCHCTCFGNEHSGRLLVRPAYQSPCSQSLELVCIPISSSYPSHRDPHSTSLLPCQCVRISLRVQTFDTPYGSTSASLTTAS